MSSIFYLGATNADLSQGTDFNKYLEISTESANSITVDRGVDNVNWVPSYAYTRLDSPDNPHWESGDITVIVRVTSLSRQLDMYISASRISSTGAVIETTTSTPVQGLSATGNYTFTIPSFAWAEGANSDRLRINYFARGTHNKLNSSMVIETGTTNASISTPITISPFAIPIIISNAATDIGDLQATLNGELTSLGDALSVDVFFQWQEIGDEIWNETIKQTRSTIGTFNELVIGLSSGVDYNFRAVVNYNNNGTRTEYATILTFKTTVIYYNLSITASGEGQVILDGTSITLPYSASIIAGDKILEGVPDLYKEFNKWTVNTIDDFNNPLLLYLDEDKTVVVYFEPQNAYIVEKYIVDTWAVLATLSLETTTHKDSSIFTIGTEYHYRLLKVENGVVVTPPTLTGELELVDAPATIRLNWGSTAGLADPIIVTYQDPDRVFIERK